MKKKPGNKGKHHGGARTAQQQRSPAEDESSSSSSNSISSSPPDLPDLGLAELAKHPLVKKVLENLLALLRVLLEWVKATAVQLHSQLPPEAQEKLARVNAWALDAWKRARPYAEHLWSLLPPGVQEFILHLDVHLLTWLKYSVYHAQRIGSLLGLLAQDIFAQSGVYIRAKYKSSLKQWSRLWPGVKKYSALAVQFFLMLCLLVVDAVVRTSYSLFNVTTATLLFIVWSFIFGLIAGMGLLPFVVLLAFMAAWTLFISVWVPAIVLAFATLWAAIQSGIIWSSIAISAVAGGAYFAQHGRAALLIGFVYAIIENYLFSGAIRIGLCLLWTAITVEAIYVISSVREGVSPSWTQSSFASSAAATRGGAQGASTSWTSSFSSMFQRRKPEEGPKVQSGTVEAEEEEKDVGGTGEPGEDVGPEMAARREITRILRCKNHYAVLQMEMYAEADASDLKREYRKKAILVHPDKNSNNEKRAREAFQSLQSAYEVVSDAAKKKEYDEELRQRLFIEMLQDRAKRSMQNPASTSGKSDEAAEGSRRMGCTTCGGSHLWIATTRRKSQARWCQECKVYHPAKDGEGWMERHPVPIMFGWLSSLGPCQAYTCSDGKVFDITDWVECQGLRCPVNTHKSTFSYTTSTVDTPSSPPPRRNGTKASSQPRPSPSSAGGPPGGAPGAGREGEEPTEEELLDFLAAAVDSGAIDPEELLEALKRGSFEAGQEAAKKAKSKPSSRKRGKAKG